MPDNSEVSGLQVPSSSLVLPSGMSAERLVLPEGSARDKIIAPSGDEDATELITATKLSGTPPGTADGEGISSQERMLYATYPWKFIGQIASATGLDLRLPISRLEANEDEVIGHNRIYKLLKSDKEEDLDEAFRIIEALPKRQIIHWTRWLWGQTKDRAIRERIVQTSQKYAYPVLPGRHPVQKPREPEIESEFEIASKWNPGGLQSIFARPVKVIDYGREAGQITVRGHSPFEIFIDNILEKSSGLIPDADSWNSLMLRITRLADTLRYKGMQFRLDCPKAAEAVVEHLRNISGRGRHTTQTWDLLIRMEVPQDLAGSILSLMERHRDLDHPLALRLLGELREDHPFLEEQRRRINILEELCTGTPDEVLSRWEKISKIQSGIVSIYPRGVPDKKAGFDLETWPKIIGVPLPEGVDIGIDGGGTMPELRLVPVVRNLTYDAKWRRRMADLWLWSQTAKTTSASLHLHIDESKHVDNYEWILRRLFGYEHEDLHWNHGINTFEVRTALEGYGGGNRTFTDGFRPYKLLEFLLSLDVGPRRSIHLPSDAILDSYDELDPLQKRFLTVCTLLEKPDTRAAAVLALHSHLGLRVRALAGSDEFKFMTYGANYGGLREDLDLLPEGERVARLEEGLESYISEIAVQSIRLIGPKESASCVNLIRRIIAKAQQMYDREQYEIFDALVEAIPDTSIPENEKYALLKDIYEQIKHKNYYAREMGTSVDNIDDSIVGAIVQLGITREEKQEFLTEMVERVLDHENIPINANATRICEEILDHRILPEKYVHSLIERILDKMQPGHHDNLYLGNMAISAIKNAGLGLDESTSLFQAVMEQTNWKYYIRYDARRYDREYATRFLIRVLACVPHSNLQKTYALSLMREIEEAGLTAYLVEDLSSCAVELVLKNPADIEFTRALIAMNEILIRSFYIRFINLLKTLDPVTEEMVGILRYFIVYLEPSVWGNIRTANGSYVAMHLLTSLPELEIPEESKHYFANEIFVYMKSIGRGDMVEYSATNVRYLPEARARFLLALNSGDNDIRRFNRARYLSVLQYAESWTKLPGIV